MVNLNMPLGPKHVKAPFLRLIPFAEAFRCISRSVIRCSMRSSHLGYPSHAFRLPCMVNLNMPLSPTLGEENFCCLIPITEAFGNNITLVFRSSMRSNHPHSSRWCTRRPLIDLTGPSQKKHFQKIKRKLYCLPKLDLSKSHTVS